MISQTSIQLTGLLIWRFGLFLAGATGLYRMTRFLLNFVELPLQLEIGLGCVFSGTVVFFSSLVWERMVDSRNEKGIKM